MKNKTIILFTLVVVAFIFGFANLSWADRYRSERRHYYYGDNYSHRYDRKPPRHYQKHHYKKHSPKYYSPAYERYRPPRQDIHVYNKHVHVYKDRPRHVYSKRYPAYYNRYRPYPPVYAGSGFYFGTAIFDPGFSMAFSIMGR